MVRQLLMFFLLSISFQSIAMDLNDLSCYQLLTSSHNIVQGIKAGPVVINKKPVFSEFESHQIHYKLIGGEIGNSKNGREIILNNLNSIDELSEKLKLLISPTLTNSLTRYVEKLDSIVRAGEVDIDTVSIHLRTEKSFDLPSEISNGSSEIILFTRAEIGEGLWVIPRNNIDSNDRTVVKSGVTMAFTTDHEHGSLKHNTDQRLLIDVYFQTLTEQQFF